ncbi:MAG TPA: WD40 repeat domain-containing protein [Cyclobacteriaceae bacterium]|jgi:WD40 repeat protein|nr:WD40 repeat domain-containing protein [Cyclobacteriaceae bacterium]
MRNLIFGLSCAALVFHADCFCQSKNEQIKQLQKIAQDNELRAKNAEEQAEKYNRIAQEAQREVERQRYLSLAVGLSRKSLDADDNALAGLLALQAYNYHLRYKGYEFDKDIYQGLLAALLRFDSGLRKLAGHVQSVRGFISKPDMPSILAWEECGRVLRWSDDQGKWEEKELAPAKEGFEALGACVRQDNRLWVIGKKKDAASRVGIYDITYSSKKIEGVHEQIGQISFSPEASNFYALSGSGHSIFLCDPQKGSEVVHLGEKIVLMDVSRDGSKLAGATAEGNLYLWDTKKNYSRAVYKISEEGNQITAIAFTPLGRDLVFGDEKGRINFLSTENGGVRKTLSGHFSEIKKIVFGNLGSLMAVADKSNTIRVWNASDLSQLPLAIKEDADIGSFQFLPDETQLVCVANGKDVIVHSWPLKTELLAREICKFIPRNMSIDDWDHYVPNAPYEATCPIK